jgi:cytochrome P450
LNPTIAEEVVDAMRLELPQNADWTEVRMNDKILRIVAMVSGRVFVGPELCRSEAYLDAAINYTVDLMTAVHIIGFIPIWLRPIVSRLLPQVRKVKTRIAEAEKLFRPIVATRQKAAENPDYSKPDDMLQWLIDSQQRFGQLNDAKLAKNQLDISFAAIHTVTMTTMNA